MDRTLSLESLIKVIEEEKNKTPRTERRLAGLKEALRLQEASNLSTQQAVSCLSQIVPKFSCITLQIRGERTTGR